MRRILIYLTGVFSLTPGLVTMQNGLGTHEKHKVLFGGVKEAMGVLLLLILWNQRGNIQKWSVKQLRIKTIIIIILFLVELINYISIFSYVDIKHETRGELYFPLFPQGELKEMIDKSGSRIGAIENYGIDALEEKLILQPEISFVITNGILLLLYLLTFLSLVLGFGFNGFYSEKNIPQTKVK